VAATKSTIKTIVTNNSGQVNKLLEYDLWASRLLMNYLPYLNGEGLEGAVRLLSHITNAQDIWLSRISDHVISGGVWDSFDIAALITRIEYLTTSIARFCPTYSAM